jgi:hypothetical protein
MTVGWIESGKRRDCRDRGGGGRKCRPDVGGPRLRRSGPQLRRGTDPPAFGGYPPPVAAVRFEHRDRAATLKRTDAPYGSTIPRLRPGIATPRACACRWAPRTRCCFARPIGARARAAVPRVIQKQRMAREQVDWACPRLRDLWAQAGDGAPAGSVRPRSIPCAIANDEAACSDRRRVPAEGGWVRPPPEPWTPTAKPIPTAEAVAGVRTRAV